MWFIGGLGNPENQYKLTRHNVGFDVADALIEFNDFSLIKKDNDKELHKGKIDGKDCLICKPLTYMNLSGPQIFKIVKYYKIPINKIIIIHDDLDLEVGKVKIKIGGGNAGHNGVSSIDESIGNNYKRIKIGIGHPGSKTLVSKYVLEKFLNEERNIIDNKISKLIKYFSLIFKDDGLLLTKISL